MKMQVSEVLLVFSACAFELHYNFETTINGHSWSTFAVRTASCWSMQDPLSPHRKPLQLLVQSIVKANGFWSC